MGWGSPLLSQSATTGPVRNDLQRAAARACGVACRLCRRYRGRFSPARKRERPAWGGPLQAESGTYFCFQPPEASWYHQPLRALAIHCLEKTPRICDSHSGWPLATATSR